MNNDSAAVACKFDNSYPNNSRSLEVIQFGDAPGISIVFVLLVGYHFTLNPKR